MHSAEESKLTVGSLSDDTKDVSNQGHSIGVKEKEAVVSSDIFVAGSNGVQAPHKTIDNPFPLVCAFGFTGKFDLPPSASSTKQGFLAAMDKELVTIGELQSGMQAYQQAINSRQYTVFSTRFLVAENTATIVTIGQLDEITSYIKKIVEEVQINHDDDSTVEDEKLAVFHQAQSFVARARAILVHNHVFYKINFVLVAKKVH